MSVATKSEVKGSKMAKIGNCYGDLTMHGDHKPSSLWRRYFGLIPVLLVSRAHGKSSCLGWMKCLALHSERKWKALAPYIGITLMSIPMPHPMKHLAATNMPKFTEPALSAAPIMNMTEAN
jgi:hypothetical protein